jgi:hypothetical protein
VSDEVLWRFHFMLGTIYYTASGPHRIKTFSEGRCDPANVSENMNHLTPFLAAGFRAPASRSANPQPTPDGCARQKKPCGAGSSHPMSSRTAIPCMLIRGGTSKGAYFLASDLPSSREERDALLLSIMGSPHPDQIDGIAAVTHYGAKWRSWQSQQNQASTLISFLRRPLWINPCQVVDLPQPEPNRGEALVRVHSVAGECLLTICRLRRQP